MSKKAKRTVDLAVMAFFTYLATVSYGEAGVSGVTVLYTFVATAMAAVIVVETK